MRHNLNRKSYGCHELLFTLDREGIIQNIGKFRIEGSENFSVSSIFNT
jgi:hypothetical protein